jgi:Fe-S-cluster-containing hydrogenase component 2
VGLSVGQFGGESLFIRGVIPLPKTGGIVLIEDIQRRIHRITARSIVRITRSDFSPTPFPGWQSAGLLPIPTAERLLQEGQLNWESTLAILGTGNRALRFGSALLESGTNEVYCIEPFSLWNSKRYAGWEVEKRRFEILGGKVIEAKPIQLLQKSPLTWQLRLQDSVGVRILDVERVISAGPFRDEVGIKEYPPGAGLYEMTQTAPLTYAKDVEGWSLEEQRAKWLASKMIRSLTHDIHDQKEELDQIFRKAKLGLKHHSRHQQEPFQAEYEGKWLSLTDTKKIRDFSGAPKEEHKSKSIASIECFEDIPCQICEKICPTSAIQTHTSARSKNIILNESKCTSCSLCIQVCPSKSIPMIHEIPDRSFSLLTLAWRGTKPWKASEFGTLLNRRGESLGSARIQALLPSQDPAVQLLQLEVPTHLLWDARGIRRPRSNNSEDQAYLSAVARADAPSDKVEISLNGERRLVRDQISISMALFEIGQNRPEDALLCPDGSCNLCQILVDGTKKLACQTRIHQGISIKTSSSTLDPNENLLCPCLGISEEKVVDRVKQGKLQSPEAVLSITQIGEGKCHGQRCMGAFKRILTEQGLPASSWIDWRLPWSEWVLHYH